MINTKPQIIAFYVLLGVALLLVLLMWLPFLKLIALGAILAALFFPVRKWLEQKTSSPTLATWLTILLIFVIVMIPLLVIGDLLFNELINLHNHYNPGSLTIDQNAIVQQLPPQLQETAKSLFSDISSNISSLAAGTFSTVTNVLSHVASFGLSLFITFFTLFFFLRDGEAIKKYIISVLPLSEESENVVVSKVNNAIDGVVKGTFLVALAQGVVATIGFLIFGVPAPFLWGMFTVFAAFVPTVGTSLSIIPAVLYLLFTHHTGAALGMAIWGFVAVGLIDNVISPKLIGSRTKLYPFLVLFSVLGGIKLFGFVGLLLGPVIMALLVALLDIYRTDLKNYLEQ